MDIPIAGPGLVVGQDAPRRVARLACVTRKIRYVGINWHLPTGRNTEPLHLSDLRVRTQVSRCPADAQIIGHPSASSDQRRGFDARRVKY